MIRLVAGALLTHAVVQMQAKLKEDDYAWTYDTAQQGGGGQCNARQPRCNNTISRTDCEECTMQVEEEPFEGSVEPEPHKQGNHLKPCTGPRLPCPPEEWAQLPTSCSVKEEAGSLSAEQSCCGSTGTQSPIAANYATAPVHPTLLPTQFFMGHPMSVTPKPPKPGKAAKPAEQECSQAFMVAHRHGMTVSFDFDRYWSKVEEEYERQQEVNGGQSVGAMPIPPKPSCVLADAGWGKGHQLVEYHWHSPSEHTVDGGYYPMEAQHVHMKGHTGLIIAVFMTGSLDLQTRCLAVAKSPAFDVQCKAALFFERVMMRMPFDVNHNVVTQGNYMVHERNYSSGFRDPGMPIEAVIRLEQGAPGEFDPYSMLNTFVPYMEYFYYYLGSLTEPPCTTGIEWVLNPTVVTVFDKDLQKFRLNMNSFRPNRLRQPLGYGANVISWHPMAGVGWFTWQEGLGMNNRPIQPLLGATCPVDKGMAANPFVVDKTTAPDCPRIFWRVGSPLTIQTEPLKYLDSSPVWASGMPHSLASFMSSSLAGESDVSGSQETTKSIGSGSSGFYMALWKWGVSAAFMAVIGGICIICIHADVHKKLKKKKDDHAKEPKSARELAKASKDDEEQTTVELFPMIPAPVYSTVPIAPPVVAGVYPGNAMTETLLPVTPSGSYAVGPGATI